MLSIGCENSLSCLVFPMDKPAITFAPDPSKSLLKFSIDLPDVITSSNSITYLSLKSECHIEFNV